MVVFLSPSIQITRQYLNYTMATSRSSFVLPFNVIESRYINSDVKKILETASLALLRWKGG
jgi:hypothetical protein